MTAQRLFISTLLSPAQTRWVTSNQTPSNVKFINKWRCHESDSSLSSKCLCFFISYTSIWLLRLSLSRFLTHIQQFTLDNQRHWQRSFIHKNVCKHIFDDCVQVGVFGFELYWWLSKCLQMLKWMSSKTSGIIYSFLLLTVFFIFQFISSSSLLFYFHDGKL